MLTNVSIHWGLVTRFLIITATHLDDPNLNGQETKPKQPQTEMATARKGHKSKQSQTETATYLNRHKPKRPQIETATNRKGQNLNSNKPKWPKTETTTDWSDHRPNGH